MLILLWDIEGSCSLLLFLSAVSNSSHEVLLTQSD